ncbi:MAG: polyketide cyclase [Thermomonas hydrothermalis]|uniref:GyrI-like domain-containing protein n=1 Tax=Thermomonas hydrothermalis TaxID=213588 RepID=UPI0023544971|nr:GyrI-like domain-containing protein [Thermomonas hydrothermalis]MCL6619183.1 polyketide cyclase [Thermomonas hydrothermalis]
MTRLLEILISLLIVFTLYLVVGLLLPSSRFLVEKAETNRKLTIVFDTLNSFRRFKDWNPLVLRDPSMQLTLSGPEEGVGARLDYASKNERIGKGSYEIVESVPREKIVIDIDNIERGNNKRTAFYLKPTGRNNRNVEITQTYSVDYGWNLLGRYAGLYVARHVGDDMKLGLARLTTMLASIPNVDYAVNGSKMSTPQVVDRPAEDVLYVSAGAVERGNAQIQSSINANSEWIKRVIEANGLEAVGPVRIITTDLGRETYTFDVAQVVRRKGGGPVGKITLQGPVKYEQVPAGRAVMASYTGYMAELDNVRNALRAWAATHGYDIKDRAYEDYKAGVAAAFTADGKFDVYWPIK